MPLKADSFALGQAPQRPHVEETTSGVTTGVGDGALGREPTLRLLESLSEGDGTAFVRARGPEDLAHLGWGTAAEIRNDLRANESSDLNALFAEVNRKLRMGGRFSGFAETTDQRKARWFAGPPRPLAWIGYTAHFACHRVGPWLRFTRPLYHAITGGRNRSITKTEVLGRLVYCGFKIIRTWEEGGHLHFEVEKRGEPSVSPPPTVGLILRMKRVLKGGEIKVVYKIRTMHPYAEYLQAYVYASNALEENGKFSNDFRIATWGRFLRKTWLDELPMIVNLLKGDIKLFGVRPLSEHYLSLYPPDLREMRLRHQPGLIPPLYADLPVGLENIFESERRYLEAYERAPWTTDAKYLVRALRRILLERARSQ